MARRPHVALLVESTRAYGRGLLSGIATYLRKHGSWTIDWQERSLSEAPPCWLGSWDGDGIIARVTTRPLAQAIRALRLPTVDLYGWLPGVDWPCLRTDNTRVARLAADHFLERGFRHFAYCGFTGVNYSDERLQRFLNAVRAAGHACHVCESPRVRQTAGTAASEQQGVLYEAELAGWLRDLPKPVGVLACNDTRGQQVLNACRKTGLAVPDEVAVLGVDNNILVCNLSDPPLSSVDLNCERIGYEAAALLARLLAGRRAKTRTLLTEPRGIVTRESTDVLAVQDPEIAEAMRLSPDPSLQRPHRPAPVDIQFALVQSRWNAASPKSWAVLPRRRSSASNCSASRSCSPRPTSLSRPSHLGRASNTRNT